MTSGKGSGGRVREETRTVDLSKNGYRWRFYENAHAWSCPRRSSLRGPDARASELEGQRGRNKFLCDWSVQDFKLELEARCFSAVGCGAREAEGHSGGSRRTRLSGFRGAASKRFVWC